MTLSKLDESIKIWRRLAKTGENKTQKDYDKYSSGCPLCEKYANKQQHKKCPLRIYGMPDYNGFCCREFREWNDAKNNHDKEAAKTKAAIVLKLLIKAKKLSTNKRGANDDKQK
jgi:hypothetical protein